MKSDIVLVVGSNDLKTFKSPPPAWAGGTLVFYASGYVRRTVGHAPLTRLIPQAGETLATAILGFLNTHQIHLDKVYDGYKLSVVFQQIQTQRENQLVQDILNRVFPGR